ncbi:cysteine desulfurase family protein [Clostridium sp. Marseille-P299]|uniref:cysteine desulfurase family protein n=1 Tax=Clostridium sp. Marseille-P299 TaxID=1805477 RepID=UPI00082E42BE|nr:cysteine desulfurase family protein [Clostridium sp. Marseille-P299]
MEAYLDNAATTKVSSSVKDIMVEALEINYGNPSSMHRKGIEAENYIKEAKDIIAKTIKVDPKEIIFTSGGTESNNFALIGAALANARAGKHIITTRFEHPSVHNPLLALEDMGFRISFIPVDHNGLIDMEYLLNEICDETIIVSIMYVNNEVGAIQDIASIAKQIKNKKSDIIFHVDAIQGFGKFKIYPKRENIDMMSVSGHKIHGPKGSGFLYIKDKLKIKPIIHGGGQQKGYRSGTENVPAIAGLAQAVKEIYENHDEKVAKLYELKQHFIEEVSSIEDTTVNAIFADQSDLSLEERIRKTAPHVVSVSFAGIRSEVLLHALEDKGVYVSAGSACASNHPSLSGSLQAIGLEGTLLESTLRFSFSINTTMEEIDYAITVLKDVVPKLRRYTRK